MLGDVPSGFVWICYGKSRAVPVMYVERPGTFACDPERYSSHRPDCGWYRVDRVEKTQ